MPRFVLIDHSLCRVGGHEFDYAESILRAAEADGHQIALVTHRDFRDGARLPQGWRVQAVFPHTAHTRNAVFLGGHSHLPIGIDGKRLAETACGTEPRAPGFFQRLRRYLSCRRRISAFAHACQRAFTAIGCDAGDRVLFATATEFDLLGLARFLGSVPETRVVDWHVQFHFDVFAGLGSNPRDHEDRHVRLQQQFRHALDHLSQHRVFLYTTTEELATQYNALQVAAFRPLPYPVNTMLQPLTKAGGGAVRITCAGGVRREKGMHALGKLVRTLRRDRTLDGKLEIAAQVSPRKLARLGVSPEGDPTAEHPVPVLCLPYPVEPDVYREIICQSDIGLFLYDSEKYRVRCSGVLQEMLAAGKPVVVPGGCWLAQQIAEPVYQHVEELRENRSKTRRHADDLFWRIAQEPTPRTISGDTCVNLPAGSWMATELEVPDTTRQVVIAVEVRQGIPLNTYLTLRTEQRDATGELLRRFDASVGHRSEGHEAPALINLADGTRHMRLRIRNNADQCPLEITGVQLDFLKSESSETAPLGKVGVVAARREQIPELLLDIIRHLPHYQRSAEEFSESWREAHHPARTIEILTAQSHGDTEPGGRRHTRP
jgi:hypothetical protein